MHFLLTFSTPWPGTADSIQFFFTICQRRGATLNLNSILCEFMMDSGRLFLLNRTLPFWFWRVETFLSFSFFFKTFQNPQWTRELPQLLYCRPCRLIEFIFFGIMSSKLEKCNKKLTFLANTKFLYPEVGTQDIVNLKLISIFNVGIFEFEDQCTEKLN